MQSNALTIEGLNVFRGDAHVLRNVRLSLVSGSAVLLRGDNGAGKTSLLRAICGLLPIEEGSIRLNGMDVHRERASADAQMLYLGHQAPLKSDLSARENLGFWQAIRGAGSRGTVPDALRRMRADGFSDLPVRSLSAGQRRRVALAMLCMVDVPLWLLDEPMTNLDVAGRGLVVELMREQLARGGMVLASLHHELEGQLSACQVLHLDGGRS
ncbi:MAG: heme ABC exporter ATP-binding protein CcmA [Steroidobacteraceae bacterium]